MVYAVSDRAIHDTGRRGAKLIAHPRRRAHATIAIHWPRVIALGVNVLIWVTIITAVAHALRR